MAGVDEAFYDASDEPASREAVVRVMSDYLKQQFALGVKPHSITRHMIGLYKGAPGARTWRRFISENVSAGRSDILDRALAVMEAGRTQAA